jgi:hypothetical protein
MSHLAVQSGFKPSQIQASDVTLFSTVFGYAIMENHWNRSKSKAKGFTEEELRDPAIVLYAIMLLKTTVNSGGDFFYSMLKDLEYRKEHHIKTIRDQLDRAKKLLHGMNYRPLDMYDHLDEVMDDEKALIFANPPTYKCLALSERILTSDLCWVKVGDIKVGDKLIGFDEYKSPTGRRWYRESIVLRSDRRIAPCVEVNLSDGSSVVCTENHPWLVQTCRGAKRRYVESRYLMKKSKHGPDSTLKALRAFKVWEEDITKEAGWLVGMYDGEGHLNVRGGKKASYQMVMTQKRGAVFDKYERLMVDRGFKLSDSDGNNAIHSQISESAEIARALGSICPERLIEKFPIERPARIIDTPEVVSIVPVGMREIQSITTSTSTYIGEGFLPRRF